MLRLENIHLIVDIAPQFGGKIWRAFDKRLGKELFFKNRALQPVNFGQRKAQ